MERIITLAGEGLHARPAGQLAQIANRHKETTVRLIKEGGKEADGRSIMAMMGLGAGKGSTVTIRTTGPDEEAVMKEILDLLQGAAASH